MLDPQLFANAYQGVSWDAMRAIVYAAEGRYSECSASQAALLCEITGRTSFPTAPVSELVVAAGRGASKTSLNIHMGCSRALREYPHAPGERIKSVIITPSIHQSRQVHKRCLGLLESSAVAAPMINRSTGTTIALSTGVDIEIRPANFKVVRGNGSCYVGIDEAAFLPNDLSATPDKELLRAFRPSLARVSGSLMVMTSTVYAQSGELYWYLKEGYGLN